MTTFGCSVWLVLAPSASARNIARDNTIVDAMIVLDLMIVLDPANLLDLMIVFDPIGSKSHVSMCIKVIRQHIPKAATRKQPRIVVKQLHVVQRNTMSSGHHHGEQYHGFDGCTCIAYGTSM